MFIDLAGHDLRDWHRLGREEANPQPPDPESSLLVEASKVTKVGSGRTRTEEELVQARRPLDAEHLPRNEPARRYA